MMFVEMWMAIQITQGMKTVSALFLASYSNVVLFAILFISNIAYYHYYFMLINVALFESRIPVDSLENEYFTIQLLSLEMCY